MNTSNHSISGDADEVRPAARTKLRFAGSVVLRLLLAAVGFGAGCVLGFLVALYTGLIDFAC